MKKRIGVLAPLSIALVCCGLPGTLGRASAEEDASGRGVWRVEISVFSGLPNPVFALEEGEGMGARELLIEAVEAAKAKNGASRQPPRSEETILLGDLGYRGLRLFETDENHNMLAEAEIVGGRMLLRLPVRGSRVIPVSEDAELRLLDLAEAKGVIDKGLRALIERRIAQRGYRGARSPQRR